MNNKNKKIVYILGTKAQFIKSKHVLINLMKLGVEIVILDTGQHKELTEKELANSDLIYEYHTLSENNKNISTIPGMIYWFLKILFNRKKILLFKDVCFSLVHGDTVSTLIGLIVSKQNKSKVIHLESGYKSNNLFKPFPEEIIRGIVSRFSEVLVVDGNTQYSNVLKYKNKKKIIEIQRNTVIDSITEIKRDINLDIVDKSLLVTVHRTENIYNKYRLNTFINLLLEISNNKYFDRIEWFCHDITKNALVKNNLIEKLENQGIFLYDLIPHEDFLNRLLNSKAIITDGGSIAEECSILGLNTIIWRDVVENTKYLNENVILSKYNLDIIYNFFQNLPDKGNPIKDTYSPSKELAKIIYSLI